MKRWLVTLAAIAVCAAPLCAADMPVPQDRGALRCQRATLRLAARLMGCVTACYNSAASHAFRAEDFDLEPCAERCQERFWASTQRLVGCPLCAGIGAQLSLEQIAMESGRRSGERGYCMPSSDRAGDGGANWGG